MLELSQRCISRRRFLPRYWESPTSIGKRLTEYPQHQPAADRMAVQLCHLHAAIIALTLPALMSSASHAMEELGGLDIAVFRVPIRLRVITQSHPNDKKSGGDFRWFDAPLCQRRPDVSRALCGAQSGEPECFDWTPRCAQMLAYAA